MYTLTGGDCLCSSRFRRLNTFIHCLKCLFTRLNGLACLCHRDCLYIETTFHTRFQWIQDAFNNLLGVKVNEEFQIFYCVNLRFVVENHSVQVARIIGHFSIVADFEIIRRSKERPHTRTIPQIHGTAGVNIAPEHIHRIIILIIKIPRDGGVVVKLGQGRRAVVFIHIRGHSITHIWCVTHLKRVVCHDFI